MRKNLEIWRGEPYPLGATLTDEGVNFALYAENAIAVELCLFGSPEPTATELRIPVTDQTDQTWHVLLPETGAGRLYGYRVHWSTGQTVKIVVLRLSCAVRRDLLSVLYFPFREVTPWRRVAVSPRSATQRAGKRLSM
jgi:hypothetical protein